MRILFVAALHHPQQLSNAIAAAPAGQTPLFPPSMGQYHWADAMTRQGYTLGVFYRNLPGGSADRALALRPEKHTERLTLDKLLRALGNRLPPQANPQKRARNAALLAQIRAFKPDVLWLVGDNTVIYPETLAEARQVYGCRVVYASGTSPIVFSHPIERQAARLYDLVLVNDFYHGIQWEELGARQVVTLPLSGVNPAFHHPYTLTDAERTQYACDVGFVGTLVPDHLYRRRVQALEALRDFDLGIWTVHDVPASLRPYVRGSALGEQMLRVLSAAKITLNTHGDFMRYGGNMRTFEAAGVGVCQVADDLPGTRHWFRAGEHLQLYTHDAALPEVVQALLNDTPRREQMIASARQHVYAEHTYDHRVGVVDALLKTLAD